MSGSSTKREARQLRRLVGEEATQMMADHDTAIAQIGAGLHKTQKDVIQLADSLIQRRQDIDRNRINLETAFEAIRDQDRGLYNFRHMSLYERLRWLLFGR